LTDAAKAYIAEKGFDSDFGARPLNRAIQKYLEDPLAEEILKSNVSEGDTIQVDLDKKTNELKFKNVKIKKSTAKEKDSKK
jgi:ATP-dependent Clp protease ATP-binding subunit ClpC